MTWLLFGMGLFGMAIGLAIPPISRTIVDAHDRARKISEASSLATAAANFPDPTVSLRVATSILEARSRRIVATMTAPAWCRNGKPCSYCRTCDYCPMSECQEARSAT